MSVMRKVNNWREHLLGSRKPSFLNGFVFMFDLSENPYENAIKEYLEISTTDALFQDWKQVGQDLKNAVEKNKNLLVEHEK
jgi:hypothetical protein